MSTMVPMTSLIQYEPSPEARAFTGWARYLGTIVFLTIDERTVAIFRGSERRRWGEELAERKDYVSVYLPRLDDRDFIETASRLDRRIDQTVTDEHHVTVFYVKDGVAYSVRISLSDLLVRESIELPPVEQVWHE